ncbi:hypothetical protein V8F20_001503 [Naviculisporaceae sp. PSN 640]
MPLGDPVTFPCKFYLASEVCCGHRDPKTWHMRNGWTCVNCIRTVLHAKFWLKSKPWSTIGTDGILTNDGSWRKKPSKMPSVEEETAVGQEEPVDGQEETVVRQEEPVAMEEEEPVDGQEETVVRQEEPVAMEEEMAAWEDEAVDMEEEIAAGEDANR